MSEPRTYLFAGGGTGGHIYPGLAIAQALAALDPGSVMHFAGSRERIEARVVPQAGYGFHPIWIAGIQRRASAATLLLPLKVAVSLIQSLMLLRRLAPVAVVGTGGYVSGPVLFMAAITGRPTLIQEQNSHAGVTTRLLSRFVDEVHVAFAGTHTRLPKARRIVDSGNPVRRMAVMDRAAACARFGLDPARRVVFVFGGSQGASSINRAIAALLPRLDEAGVQLLWQTGGRDAEAMQALCTDGGHHATVRAYIDDMEAAYSAADLVVCRAGAASLAEITMLGRPAVLVPFKHAAANHQYHNARALHDAGAAVMVEDDDLGRLGEVLTGLLGDPAALARMAERSLHAGRPDAAVDIARAVLRLSHASRRRSS